MEYIKCELDVDNIVKVEFRVHKNEICDNKVPLKFGFNDYHHLHVYENHPFKNEVYEILKNRYKSEQIIKSLHKNKKVRIYFYDTKNNQSHIVRDIVDSELKHYHKIIKLIEMKKW
jgi:hypothetical protein